MTSNTDKDVVAVIA